MTNTEAKALAKSLFDRYRISMVVWRAEEDEFGDVVYRANPHGNDLRNAESMWGDVIGEICDELEAKGFRATWVNERNSVTFKSPQPSPPTGAALKAKQKRDFERRKKKALEIWDTQGKEAALALFTDEERKLLPF